jgi:hypothetical protein
MAEMFSPLLAGIPIWAPPPLFVKQQGIAGEAMGWDGMGWKGKDRIGWMDGWTRVGHNNDVAYYSYLFKSELSSSQE